MENKQPDPIIETIFETEKRLKSRGIILLKKVKEDEKIKLQNGFAWVTIDAKTRVLRKVKK
jgi:hypothetical protein